MPIHPNIAARWSPRGYDAGAVVTPDQVTALLESARWAPTWGRRQPVRFIVGVRGDDTFAGLAGLLKPGNSYAHAAGALILVCADAGPDENTALYSAVDAGAALANLSIEAVAQSLHAHPMAGFDVDGARPLFGVPDGFRPLFVVAVGSLADPADVPDEIAERDQLPRHRLPLEDIAFARAWGEPYPQRGSR